MSQSTAAWLEVHTQPFGLRAREPGGLPAHHVHAMAKVPCSMRGRKNVKRVPSSVSRFGDENVNFLSSVVLVHRGEPSWPVHPMSSRPGGIVRNGILVLGLSAH
jgi:hypothetical protein